MPLAKPITCTAAWAKAKLPTTRARWSARRMTGADASSMSGDEIDPKKLISGAAFYDRRVAALRFLITGDSRRECENSLDRLRAAAVLMHVRGQAVNLRAIRFVGRRVVVLGILVVVVLGQRGVDVVQDHAGHVDLAIVEQLERFLR